MFKAKKYWLQSLISSVCNILEVRMRFVFIYKATSWKISTDDAPSQLETPQNGVEQRRHGVWWKTHPVETIWFCLLHADQTNLWNKSRWNVAEIWAIAWKMSRQHTKKTKSNVCQWPPSHRNMNSEYLQFSRWVTDI